MIGRSDESWSGISVLAAHDDDDDDDMKWSTNFRGLPFNEEMVP